MTADHLRLIRRMHIEPNRCMALLADAIASADQWYARREATLTTFDREATDSVRRLRAAGRIQVSIGWNSTGATA